MRQIQHKSCHFITLWKLVCLRFALFGASQRALKTLVRFQTHKQPPEVTSDENLPLFSVGLCTQPDWCCREFTHSCFSLQVGQVLSSHGLFVWKVTELVQMYLLVFCLYALMSSVVSNFQSNKSKLLKISKFFFNSSQQIKSCQTDTD